MNILVTGGLGYIGSHTVVELLKEDNKIIILDNLINSKLEIKNTIEFISKKSVKFYKGDLRNSDDIEKIFINENIDIVIHFAGLKSVGESVESPLKYYENNISGTLNLLKIMNKYLVKKIIFSSSATVYGDSEIMPVNEQTPLSEPTNPYGKTKLMIENMLKDIYKADNSWSVVLLRYFNPAGAHESGLIGELPNGVPNNLMPYISKVSYGELPYVKVFGNDYNTIDGTGVRDYIHVVDLAKGHLAAIKKIEKNSSKLLIYNLGTGKGYSVLELIEAFKKIIQKEIPYKIEERRLGDIAICYASVEKAKKELNWKAEKTIEDMCKDFWNWQQNGMQKLNMQKDK